MKIIFKLIVLIFLLEVANCQTQSETLAPRSNLENLSSVLTKRNYSLTDFFDKIEFKILVAAICYENKKLLKNICNSNGRLTLSKNKNLLNTILKETNNENLQQLTSSVLKTASVDLIEKMLNCPEATKYRGKDYAGAIDECKLIITEMTEDLDFPQQTAENHNTYENQNIFTYEDGDAYMKGIIVGRMYVNYKNLKEINFVKPIKRKKLKYGFYPKGSTTAYVFIEKTMDENRSSWRGKASHEGRHALDYMEFGDKMTPTEREYTARLATLAENDDLKEVEESYERRLKQYDRLLWPFFAKKVHDKATNLIIKNFKKHSTNFKYINGNEIKKIANTLLNEFYMKKFKDIPDYPIVGTLPIIDEIIQTSQIDLSA